jgi:hypothetical protein
VDASKFISLFDAKSGFHQFRVNPKDRWLTSFICDDGQFQWTRTPFGMRSSGTTFVRGVKEILRPIRDFTKSYVDDMAVHSDSWDLHLRHITEYLTAIRTSGLTLSLKKCEFANSEIKFVGHIIGSGYRRADPDKVAAIELLKQPEIKKQVRQLLGLFSFLRAYIPNFAHTAKPLTDLTSKRVSERIPFATSGQQAFETLKLMLSKAASEPLKIMDFNRPFTLFVDASEITVGAVLTQNDDEGRLHPVAFAS